MLKEDDLIECVQDSLKGHIENVASLDSLLSSISQERINRELAQEYAGQIRANEKQLAQIEGFKTKLYENLVSGILTKEEYLSYKRKYNADIELLQKAVAEWEERLTDVLEKGVLWMLRSCYVTQKWSMVLLPSFRSVRKFSLSWRAGKDG